MRLALMLALATICSPLLAQEYSTEVTLASGQAVTPRQLDEALQKLVVGAKVAGVTVAIVNDNAVVFERAFGVSDRETNTPVDKTTLFEFASMSKPAFGALVVDLAADGVIDLDRPLAEYYPHPDLKDDPRAAKFTARQVLTHQTGLLNWRTDRPDGKLDIAFEPGAGRRYSGEAYEYLADVLMHILLTDDKGLDAIFQERIAGPSGATDTLYVQDTARVARKAKGYAKGELYAGDIDYANDGFGAAYSIHSNAGDYARLMIGLMSGRSLDEAERQQFFAPQNVDIPADDPDRALGFVDQALGYAIYDLPLGRFYAHGGNNEGFSGMSLMQPDTGWAFVIVTNEDQANDFVLQASMIMLGLAPLPGD